MLPELLKKARQKGVDEVPTIRGAANTLSHKVIETNECQLVETRNGLQFWKKILSKVWADTWETISICYQEKSRINREYPYWLEI